MTKVAPYHMDMMRPIKILFEVFWIDFAGPLPETRAGHKYLLICVEHLTGWPIAVPTRDATVETVINFISTEVIHPFGIPKTVISAQHAVLHCDGH